MRSRSLRCHLLWRALALIFLVAKALGLNTDGVVLLSFKYSILNDPLGVLQSWNYSDQIPCSWNGVTCGGPGTNASLRVTGLSLPNCQLLGSISADLGMLEHLQNLDLSSNSLNGSFPFSLLSATQLRVLDLSNNSISGGLPGSFGQLQNLQSLNLSDNALAGTLPVDLVNLHNLTVISLNNNYFSDSLPSGFETVQVLDLSSNLINGSLPLDFGGRSLSYFNVSYNRLSGPIPAAFASQIPSNCTIDFSFNSLTGEIPDSGVFLNQKSRAYAGNHGICGHPTADPCPLPSSPSPLPNVSAPTSPPAIAALPKIIASTAAITPSSGDSHTGSQNESGLRPGSIIGIIIGDIAGVAILGIVFFYVYQCLKKKKSVETTFQKETHLGKEDNWSSASSESGVFTRWSCLRKRAEKYEDCEPTSSDDEEDQKVLSSQQHQQEQHQQNNRGTLVTVDGSEKELELETLLKASAYILGATSSSIMYKAVLEDGTSLAVRRIGESHTERFRDFETQVRVIAKLVHPNLVRIRGFYWGIDEKLIIYDFVPNGSLADARYRKAGSSPCHLPWEARLKIAKGVARGLAFLHDKKHVHANLKPANILLSSDMEPRIGDFGLERLVTGGDTSWKAGGSVRNFGSKRSTASRDSFQDLIPGPTPSPSPSSIGGLSPYHAPESLRSLKPSPKWDVYSFGAIFLELLTGKVIVVDELGQGSNGLVVEDKNRALRMVDVAIRADVDGKEDALLACFKLGYNCASPSPQKRPTMKEVLQVLDKVPTSTSYFHGPL